MVRRGDRPHHALSARPVLPGRAVRHSACAAHTLRRLDGRLVWQAATDLCRYVGRRAPRNLEGTGFVDLPQNPGHAETPAALAGWRDIRPLLRRMISAEWPKSNLVHPAGNSNPSRAPPHATSALPSLAQRNGLAMVALK